MFCPLLCCADPFCCYHVCCVSVLQLSVQRENQGVISKKSLGIIQGFMLSHDGYLIGFSILDRLQTSLLKLNTKELMVWLFTHCSLL